MGTILSGIVPDLITQSEELYLAVAADWCSFILR